MAEAETHKPIKIEPGADPDEVRLNQKNNLDWDDIKGHLLPSEREHYEKNPEQVRKIVAAVNMMPNVEEWDAAAKAGMVGHLWYERSSRAFDALIEAIPSMFRKRDKEKFLNFVSALSPVQTVRLNLGMAIDLWGRWVNAGRPMDVKWKKPKTFEGVRNEDSKLYRMMAGLEEEEAPAPQQGALFADPNAKPVKRKAPGVALNSRLSNAIRALQGQPLSGPKVSAFAPNLGENADKSTNDTWMAVFGDTNPNIINQKPLYDAMTTHVRMAAEKNGISTRQAQAAIWSFIKTLAEMSGWGGGRWIPPQDIIDRGLLTPDMIARHSQDFADLMLNDPGIRRKLKKIGADLNVLDRKLSRRVPAKPATEQGTAKELAERLSGAASRLETARTDPNISRRIGQKVDPQPRLPKSEAVNWEALSLDEIREEIARGAAMSTDDARALTAKFGPNWRDQVRRAN
jgi:hypothetical protein